MANMTSMPAEDAIDDPIGIQAREKIEDVRKALADADQRARSLIVEHPFIALGGALFIGYAVGRLLRKI